MKKILNAIFTLVLLYAGIFTFSAVKVNAANPVDELKDYTITVDVRNDGTLDISYD